MDEDVILLAEDSDDEAFLFERALAKSHCGLRMIRVKDGAEVFDYYENKGSYADRLRFPKPYIIISDLNMPKNGGLLVLNWLKERDLLGRTTFVLFTSSEKASEIEQAMAKGAHAYVIKAMPCEEMADWLRETVRAIDSRRFEEHGWLRCPHNEYLHPTHLRVV